MLEAGTRRCNALDRRSTLALRAARPGRQGRHLRFRHEPPRSQRADETKLGHSFVPIHYATRFTSAPTKPPSRNFR
jgi:hypothetical protein